MVSYNLELTGLPSLSRLRRPVCCDPNREDGSTKMLACLIGRACRFGGMEKAQKMRKKMLGVKLSLPIPSREVQKAGDALPQASRTRWTWFAEVKFGVRSICLRCASPLVVAHEPG
jgi:hypothetical protein